MTERELTVTAGALSRHVPAGEALTIGRGPTSPHTGVDIGLVIDDHPALHRHAATIIAEPSGWAVTANGRLRVAVVDRRSGGRVWAMPQQGPLRVGFPEATLEVEPVPGHVIEIEVCDPRPHAPTETHDTSLTTAPSPESTAVIRIDETAGYFRALVVLCTPLFDDAATVELPSDQEIALRLNRAGLEKKRQTVRSVEHRLAYARQRLGLAAGTAGTEVTAAREKLARFAVTSGAVRREHLFI